MKNKKILIWAMLFAIIFTSLTGCSSKRENSEINSNNSQEETASNDNDVNLIVWCEEDTFDIINKMCDSFKEQYKDANITITLEAHSDSEMNNEILANVNANFDVFSFPDDQFDGFNAAGVLDEIPNSEEIKNRTLEGAVDSATYDGKMYAYPYTADNGYFLYYNKAYLTDNDVKTLDEILKVCNEQGKKIQMNLSSGWYMYSFYGQTGLNFGINEDGLTNYCDWNLNDGDVKGIDVAKAIRDLALNDGFIEGDDTTLIEGLKNNTIIAGVSGAWSSAQISNILKNNYGAVKLPTYTCGDKQIQMATFNGYKMYGVNHYSKNKEWAHKLADWITNEENQAIRLEAFNQGPANKTVAASDAVKNNPAIAAIMAESEYGIVQRVGNSYWDACTEFVKSIKPGMSDNELQEILDKMVEKITTSVGN